MSEGKRQDRMVQIIKEIVMSRKDWFHEHDLYTIETMAEDIARNATQALMDVCMDCDRDAHRRKWGEP